MISPPVLFPSVRIADLLYGTLFYFPLEVVVLLCLCWFAVSGSCVFTMLDSLSLLLRKSNIYSIVFNILLTFRIFG